MAYLGFGLRLDFERELVLDLEKRNHQSEHRSRVSLSSVSVLPHLVRPARDEPSIHLTPRMHMGLHMWVPVFLWRSPHRCPCFRRSCCFYRLSSRDVHPRRLASLSAYALTRTHPACSLRMMCSSSHLSLSISLFLVPSFSPSPSSSTLANHAAQTGKR